MSQETITIAIEVGRHSKVESYSRACYVPQLGTWVQGYAKFESDGTLSAGIITDECAQGSDVPEFLAVIALYVSDQNGILRDKELQKAEGVINWGLSYEPIEDDLLSYMTRAGFFINDVLTLKFKIEAPSPSDYDFL